MRSGTTGLVVIPVHRPGTDNPPLNFHRIDGVSVTMPIHPCALMLTRVALVDDAVRVDDHPALEGQIEAGQERPLRTGVFPAVSPAVWLDHDEGVAHDDVDDALKVGSKNNCVVVVWSAEHGNDDRFVLLFRTRLVLSSNG